MKSSLEHLCHKSKLLKADRELILKRDNYTCQECGIELLRPEDMKKFPHVHHKDRIKFHNDPSNLSSLCSGCHQNRRGATGKRGNRKYSYITLSALARECGINRMTAINWRRRGYIKATELPNGWYLVSPEELVRIKNLFSGSPTLPLSLIRKSLRKGIQDGKTI